MIRLGAGDGDRRLRRQILRRLLRGRQQRGVVYEAAADETHPFGFRAIYGARRQRQLARHSCAAWGLCPGEWPG